MKELGTYYAENVTSPERCIVKVYMSDSPRKYIAKYENGTSLKIEPCADNSFMYTDGESTIIFNLEE